MFRHNISPGRCLCAEEGLLKVYQRRLDFSITIIIRLNYALSCTRGCCLLSSCSTVFFSKLGILFMVAILQTTRLNLLNAYYAVKIGGHRVEGMQLHLLPTGTGGTDYLTYIYTSYFVCWFTKKSERI